MNYYVNNISTENLLDLYQSEIIIDRLNMQTQIQYINNQ